MNFSSLRFKLLAWFTGLLVLVVVVFGFSTYGRIERFVVEVQRSSLAHRAEQITGMLLALTAGEEVTLGAKVEARFAPSLNDKFVRVTRADGAVLYRSGEPADRSFDPDRVPAFKPGTPLAEARREHTAGDGDLLISAVAVAKASGTYYVEVGASLGESYRLLRALLLTLAAGLPVVLLIAVTGGYVLIWRALRPVHHMMHAAQEITLHHLSRRLPVPASGDEIANLALALNQMIARLDESFQHTSRFTADASHELRTPLTIVRGEVEALLLRQDVAASIRGELASVLEEIERLVRIVEGLFALSRLDTGEAQAERVRFDLASLAETTAEQMCLLAEEKKINLQCAMQQAVEVEGDRARLKQVIVNLLDNAIKYTPPQGSVTMTVRVENGSALLEVSDSGSGVPEAALPHLFERFYRADQARSSEAGGAGLGLSIVQSICAAHGGSVVARNLKPTGFAVVITLPRSH